MTCSVTAKRKRLAGPSLNGSQNPLTHIGREGPEQVVRFEDDGLDGDSSTP